MEASVFAPLGYRTLFGGGAYDPGDNDPMVVMEMPTYCKIHELTLRSRRYEVGWFGTVVIHEGWVEVDNIFLPKQEVTGCTTDIQGLGALAGALLKQGRQDLVERLHFWGHCHPGDSVTPSGLDERTYEELIKDCPTLLMGIFSSDARKAWWRMRWNNMNLRMGWKVLVRDTFEDFEEKVTVEKPKEYKKGKKGDKLNLKKVKEYYDRTKDPRAKKFLEIRQKELEEEEAEAQALAEAGYEGVIHTPGLWEAGE